MGICGQARNRDHMLQSEKKHLKQYMKLENVERVKRIQEYKRLEASTTASDQLNQSTS